MIIDKSVLPYIDFDPSQEEHRRAYLMLQYQGRQHPKLRFILKVPYISVLNMMQEEMAKYLCQKEIMELGIDTEYRLPDSGYFKEGVSEVRVRHMPFPQVFRSMRKIDASVGVKEGEYYPPQTSIPGVSSAHLVE